MGSFDSITAAIQFDDVRIALKKLLSTTEFVLKSYEILSAGDGLLGFLGEHFRVHVTYELHGKISEVYLFSKLYPVNNKERAAFNDIYGTFKRENFVYTNIIDIFKKNEERRWHPYCYLATDRLFLFEDLSAIGYKMRRVGKEMDEAHCIAALTCLARFHSATITYENDQSDKNFRLQNIYEDDLCETIFAYNSWMRIAIDIALKLAESSEKYGKDTQHFKTVVEKWTEVFKRGVLLSGPSKDTRNVVTHGDLWNNNFMYRYDDCGKPIQCMLMDFQACRFAPPAADVMSFLQMNFSIEQLDQKTDFYLSLYYKELSNVLSESGIKLDDILSWNEFLTTCNVHRNWGMVQTVINLQFMYLDPVYVTDACNDSDVFYEMAYGGRCEVLLKLFKSDAVYKKRVLSMIDKLIETYIIL